MCKIREKMMIYMFFVLSVSSITGAQMLIPLYGACTSSVQCVGVAICVNHVCQCPPSYSAVGITCVYGGVDGDIPPPLPATAIGANPPLSMAAPTMPLVAPLGTSPFLAPPPLGPSLAIAAPPPPSLAFGYPGLPCPPGRPCIGNSICVQGTCGCPSGQVVAGYSCVPPARVIPGPPVPAPGPLPPPPPPYPGPPMENDLDFLLRGPPTLPMQGPALPVPAPAAVPGFPVPPASMCPPNQIPIGLECLPPAAIVNYPNPVPCQPNVAVPCVGGASCVNGICACPPPFVWTGSGCMAPPPATPSLLSLALPPPPAPAPFPYPGYPVAVRPGVPIAAPLGPGGFIPLGAPCTAHNQCTVGAYCPAGICQCRPAFLPFGNICILRRRSKNEVEHKRTNNKSKKRT